MQNNYGYRKQIGYSSLPYNIWQRGGKYLNIYICTKYCTIPHICKPEHPYIHCVKTVYTNYVHEFDQVKPSGPYQSHVLLLLISIK